MGRDSVLSAVLRLVKSIVLIDLAIAGIVIAICWIGGWQTVDDFANGVFWAGLAAMLVGGMSVLGGTGLAQDSTYRYAQTAGDTNARDTTRRGWQDLNASYAFLVRMGIVGATCIGLSEIIKSVS